jgi:arylsulfatase A-like enzyme
MRYIICVLVALVQFCANLFSQQVKPNVVVIYVDDLDYDELSIYGSENPTPNIDKFAYEGMQFTRGYVTSTICTPSRYGLVTGNFASRSIAIQTNLASTWRNRLYPPGTDANVHFNTILTPGEKTFGNYMQEAGYITGMTGKWHMACSADGEYMYKDENGNFTKPKIPLKHEESYDSPYNQKAINEHYKTVTEYVGSNFGFDYVDGFYEQNAAGLRQSGYPEIYQKHNLEWITTKANSFVNENKDKPFFLYYALTLPHGEEGGFLKKLNESDVTITPAGRVKAAPNSGMPDRGKLKERVEKNGLRDRSACMMYVDDAIGALLENIKQAGIEENTLVFLISDHGNYAKLALFDGGARIPFMAKWPGKIEAGSTCDEIVANIDVLPTILDITDAKTQTQFDGKSFYSLLKGSNKEIRDALLLEAGYAKAIVTKTSKLIYVRFPQDEWETINGHGGIHGINYNASEASFARGQKYNYPGYWDFNQYYDLENDPGEQNNIYNKSQDEVREMEILMKRELDKLPHTFGEIKPN